MNKSVLTLLMLGSMTAHAAPYIEIDLLGFPTDDSQLQRVYGSVGDGSYGVPVAGTFDLDGDGDNDYAFSAMEADVPGRPEAGQVFLIFGDGNLAGSINTAQNGDRVLPIHGSQQYEHAGSEIWMAEVTGDSLGDLIICRQDYSQSNLAGTGFIGSGEGAMTIIPGQAALKTMAENGNEVLDLANIPANIDYTTIIGASPFDRLCMWARNGDLTADGQDDIAVSADQENSNNQVNSGAVYVIRGGSHLQDAGELDLADFGDNSFMPGNIMRVRPSTSPLNPVTLNGGPVSSPIDNGNDNTSEDFHIGATLNIAELDNSGADLMFSAALNRAGGILCSASSISNCRSQANIEFAGDTAADASGGSSHGVTYILWEDNFTGNWVPAPDFEVTSASGSLTIIDGGDRNDTFGEELIGGLDYNGDGEADFFAGDLVGDGLSGTELRINAGTGHIFYSAQNLRDRAFDFDTTPADIRTASFLGPVIGAISGDTNMHGDFNNDGVDDIASSSPHDAPLGRTNAGTLHVFLGEKDKYWPRIIDLRPSRFPSQCDVKIVNVYGAVGNMPSNTGDTLAYSGADGDVNGDGYIDILTNEMVGDGRDAIDDPVVDTGNLIILSGSLFEIREELNQNCDFCFVIPTAEGAAAICLPG
ncbi:MAG: hypothetical protein AAF402_13215 [Pseudomonadota bacterium]